MSTIIEHETLGKIVDGLIAKKYPDQSPDNLSELRENTIAELDEQVITAVFNELTDPEINEINTMFDKEESDPTAFQIFFKNAGVDLEQVISDVLTQFSQKFLEEDNKND